MNVFGKELFNSFEKNRSISVFSWSGVEHNLSALRKRPLINPCFIANEWQEWLKQWSQGALKPHADKRHRKLSFFLMAYNETFPSFMHDYASLVKFSNCLLQFDRPKLYVWCAGVSLLNVCL